MVTSETLRIWFAVVLAIAIVLGALVVVLVAEWPSHASQSTPPPSGYEILHTARVGESPAGVLYDPSNGLVYVANGGSGNISVLNATTLHVVQNIFTGFAARGLALDPANGRLFVANDFSSNVTVIDTVTNTILANPGWPNYSYMVGAEFDPYENEVYIVANNNPDLLALNPSTYAIDRVIPLDPNPGGGEGFAIDLASHVIYFPARGLLSLALIGETNGSTFTHIPLPGYFGPTTTFYDPANGLIYAMLGGLLDDPGNQLVMVNSTTGAIVNGLTVGLWPDSYAYDLSAQLLFLSCTASGEVWVIDTATDQAVTDIALGSTVQTGSIAVDPTTGHVFVAQESPGELIELSRVSSPQAVIAHPTLSSVENLSLFARWTTAANPMI